MKFSFIKSNPNLQFVRIDGDEVEQVEKELGIVFPTELKLFFADIGYGSFVGEDELDENCVLSPALIRDFRLRQGFFEAYPKYDEENKLIFFIGWESIPFSIELTDGEQSPIYDDQKKIANSLEEFLSKITEDPEYFQQD
ncbi:SMI1/KNR4 family protein [Metasolibacillus meyeri]|uniref:SMI1/KNR4 family protein n=1 Tax=Metasolibacillus meyeri TaxID=1071052 RepID=A0AAW9NVS3_9BACL|nr:SMI1/KNR4 family protein [Metasolibacillus meyeri]MEC1180005.1 SMI1/KNR4 family protein [Metasolibacillus meyeri]